MKAWSAPLAQVPSLAPDADAIPGGEVAQNIVNGLAYFALLAALAGMLIGGIVWALGSHSNNFHNVNRGKQAVLVSVAVALMVGASGAIVRWAFTSGETGF